MMDGLRNGKVSTEMKNLARTTTQMNYDMASAGPRGLEVSYTPHTGGWIRWEGAWAGKCREGPCVGVLAQKIEDIKRFREVRKGFLTLITTKAERVWCIYLINNIMIGNCKNQR